MNKKELVKYLDEYLRISEYSDSSKNGLQIDSTKEEINKIGYAVDATSYIFEKAKEEGCDMVISHHGIYWGREETLTGVAFNRAKILLENNICTYASHLPLDAHSEVGNNIGLLKAFINIFGIQDGEYEIEEICEYKGKTIGFGLKLKHKLHVSNLVTPYAERMQLLKRFYNFGNLTYFTSIAFVSGGALSEVKEMKEKGYDVFLTGEGAHHELTLAKELEQCILIGGHYETEKIGPKLLAHHIKEKFGLETVFLDEKY